MRTWAPKGQTPVIQFHFNWKQLSVIAGLTFTHCVFRLHQGTIRSPQIVEFLKALRRHLKRRLLIVWDGLRAYFRPSWTAFQADRGRLGWEARK